MRVLNLILRHMPFLTEKDVTETALPQAWAVQELSQQSDGTTP